MGKPGDLQTALDHANRAVADWTRTIASIATQRDAASRSLAAAAKVREQHALAAATGDEDAVATVKRARAEQRDAEEVLADLAIAGPKAEHELAAARKSVELAQHALARHQAEGIMLERLGVAARIDAILADLAEAHAAYEKLGRAIVAVPNIIPANVHGMTNALVEQVIGDRRLRAALPAGFVRRFFPSAIVDDQRHAMLADTERQVMAPLSATGLTDKAAPSRAAA
jgi:hypothetical protein